jgi:hypothetical protein
MKAFNRIFTAVVFFSVIGSPLRGLQAQTVSTTEVQEHPRYIRIVMTDGSIKLGEWVNADENHILIKSEGLGLVNVPKYLVQQVVDLEESLYVRLAENNRGRSFDINPQASRYFFAPSGHQLKKGEGYFQSNIALNSVSLGVTDGLTVGGLISFFGAGGSVKLGAEITENVHVSVGGIGIKDFFGEFEKPIGLFFGNITWGTEDRHLTINLGSGSKLENGLSINASHLEEIVDEWGYAYTVTVVTDYDQVWTRPLLLSVSAMTQISENRWFVTENYLINPMQSKTPGNDILTYNYPPQFNNADSPNVGIVSMGIRNLSRRSGWLWDYGMVGIIGDDFGAAIPWVSATLAF